jgi:outer membrane protein assembly factor BamE (lipoprotein component of BamABCDE complex)
MSDPLQPQASTKDRTFLWIGILSAVTLIACLLFYGWLPTQQYGFSPYPLGTVFAPKYTDVNFRLVRVGMHRDEVVTLLGEPLTIYRLGETEQWHYAEDRFGLDFKWLMRIVNFDEDGIVDEINSGVIED